MKLGKETVNGLIVHLQLFVLLQVLYFLGLPALHHWSVSSGGDLLHSCQLHIGPLQERHQHVMHTHQRVDVYGQHSSTATNTNSQIKKQASYLTSFLSVLLHYHLNVEWKKKTKVDGNRNMLELNKTFFRIDKNKLHNRDTSYNNKINFISHFIFNFSVFAKHSEF